MQARVRPSAGAAVDELTVDDGQFVVYAQLAGKAAAQTMPAMATDLPASDGYRRERRGTELVDRVADALRRDVEPPGVSGRMIVVRCDATRLPHDETADLLTCIY